MSEHQTVEHDASELYDWTTFEEGEVVQWEGKPHIYSLIPVVLIGIPLSIVLIGIGLIAYAWVARENTTYVITNRAVYKKRGAVSREVKRVSIEKIQNTSLKQGAAGTYFDYGNVEISTAGSEGAEVTFESVAAPRSVQQRLNRQVETLGAEEDDTPESKQAIGTEDQTVEVLQQIHDELVTIRAAVAEGDESVVRDD